MVIRYFGAFCSSERSGVVIRSLEVSVGGAVWSSDVFASSAPIGEGCNNENFGRLHPFRTNDFGQQEVETLQLLVAECCCHYKFRPL